MTYPLVTHACMRSGSSLVSSSSFRRSSSFYSPATTTLGVRILAAERET
jgi:hypothetical protein